MTEPRSNQPIHPRIPAAHYGRGFAPFEDEVMRRFGLSPLDARALLVIMKWNGHVTCANLGSELWSEGRPPGNCSCPWARPAGVVIKRLLAAGLVERDFSEPDRKAYKPTRKSLGVARGTNQPR